jgi:hypothetical protein
MNFVEYQVPLLLYYLLPLTNLLILGTKPTPKMLLHSDNHPDIQLPQICAR